MLRGTQVSPLVLLARAAWGLVWNVTPKMLHTHLPSSRQSFRLKYMNVSSYLTVNKSYLHYKHQSVLLNEGSDSDCVNATQQICPVRNTQNLDVPTDHVERPDGFSVQDHQTAKERYTVTTTQLAATVVPFYKPSHVSSRRTHLESRDRTCLNIQQAMHV